MDKAYNSRHDLIKCQGTIQKRSDSGGTVHPTVPVGPVGDGSGSVAEDMKKCDTNMQKTAKRPRREIKVGSVGEFTLNERLDCTVRKLEESREIERKRSSVRNLIKKTLQEEVIRIRKEIENVIMKEVSRGIKQMADEFKQLKLSVEIFKQREESARSQDERNREKAEGSSIQFFAKLAFKPIKQSGIFE